MNPLISVIIPIYNIEDFLPQCIDSVINQTYQELEIILVNDGSKDSSLEICRKYSERDHRIIIVDKENGGLADARNAGIYKATGEYIIFIDGDDFWYDESMLSNMSTSILNNTDLIMFYFKRCDEKAENIWEAYPQIDEYYVNRFDYDEAVMYLLQHAVLEFSACTKLIKRQLIMDNQLFFQKGLYSEDIDWCFSLLLCAHSQYTYNLSDYIYRIRGNSITKSVGEKNCQDIYYIICKWAEKIKNGVISSEMKNALLGYLAYQFYILLGHALNANCYKKIHFEKIAWLTQYSINYKTRLCQLLYRIFGRKLTAKVCAKYICSKRQ